MTAAFDEPLCPPSGPPASVSLPRAASGAAGSIATFSADTVPPAQRMEYWHDSVLRRLNTKAGPAGAKPFQGHLVRIMGEGAEMLQHSADSLVAQRSAQRCRSDGHDDIAIDFVVAASRASLTHAGTRRLRNGDLIVVDCAQPAEINRARHRVISLFIPSAKVSAVFTEPALLAGRLLPTHGLAALLRSHMRATMEQAAHLLSAQRLVAINAASDMALSILQTQTMDGGVTEDFANGTYHAALALIAQECTNPELTSLHIAWALGCSRAALYRAFAQQSAGVAAAIWSARIEHARHMLLSANCSDVLLSEIAFSSGFGDHSTFVRMFRRSYGVTPSIMRQTSAIARRGGIVAK